MNSPVRVRENRQKAKASFLLPVFVFRVTPEGMAQIYCGSSEHKSSNLEIPLMYVLMLGFGLPPDVVRLTIKRRHHKDPLYMKIAISSVNNEQSWSREDNID